MFFISQPLLGAFILSSALLETTIGENTLYAFCLVGCFTSQSTAIVMSEQSAYFIAVNQYFRL